MIRNFGFLGLSAWPQTIILFCKTMRISPTGTGGAFAAQPASAAQRGWLAFFCACIVAALLGFAPVARADEADARLEAIRADMDKGQGLFLAGKYEEAAQAFEAGYKSHPYSAFLFNAGVCYQKVGKADAALQAFRTYLSKDPAAPDAPQVQERISAIEVAVAEAKKATDESGSEEPAETVALPDRNQAGMKSLVVIETEPPGAPVKVYRRLSNTASAFVPGQKNPDFSLVVDKTSPLNLSLDLGRYHIEIEKFQDYNRAATDLDVSEGHVHHFRANLSQGEFMGFLQVESNVTGATLYLDDDGERKVVWGETPHGALVPPGEHVILVEAPGYEPQELEVTVETGDKKELEVVLKRVGFGVLRLDANVKEVTLSVDQRPVGVWREGESAFEAELPSGKHDILISSKGYKDLRKTVTVPAGQILPMRAQMVEKFPRGAAWTQAVLSAAFLGAGVYFGVESNRLNNELKADNEAGYLYNSDPRLNQGLWYSVGANTGFALGGILAALSTYNFIRDPYPDPTLQKGKLREFKKIRRPAEEPAPAAESRNTSGARSEPAPSVPSAAKPAVDFAQASHFGTVAP